MDDSLELLRWASLQPRTLPEEPPVGDLVPPVGDLVPPVGDLVPPVGDLVPPVGDLVPSGYRSPSSVKARRRFWRAS